MATKLSVVDHLDEEVKKRGRREGEEEAAGDSRSEPLPPAPSSAVNYQMRSVGLPGGNFVSCRDSFNEFNRLGELSSSCEQNELRRCR